jgi:hypothetical protein
MENVRESEERLRQSLMDAREQIAPLKKRIKEIRDDFTALISQKSEIFGSFCQQIDSKTQKKLDYVEKRRQEEINLANKEFDANSKFVDDEISCESAGVRDHVIRVTKWKYLCMCRAFPDMASWIDKSCDSEFLRVMREESQGPASAPGCGILDLSDDPLIPLDEIERLNQKWDDTRKWRVRHGMLCCGAKRIPIGNEARVVLRNGLAKPINGFLQEVKERVVLMKSDEGNIIQIPIMSLSLKLCSLDRI